MSAMVVEPGGEERRSGRWRVPPHILWPGLVVAILAGSVLANVVLVMASMRDGGAQVEEDYYERAVRWDAAEQARVQSARLGWSTKLRVEAPGAPVIVLVTDREGRPVEGLEGEVRARRPSQARGSVAPLEAIAGVPGGYRAAVVVDRVGVWDLALDARRGQERVLVEQRQELSGR